MQKLTKLDYQIRLSVLLLAFISPLIYLMISGYQPSLSSYWNTICQPMFIVVNTSTAFYLTQIKNWKMSALTLLLLTAFSIALFPNTHNVLATLFFVVTIYPLWITHHFKWVVWLYMISLLIFPFNMLIAEIVAMWLVCLHQGLVLIKLYKLSNRVKNNIEYE